MIGSVWNEESWHADAWDADAWADVLALELRVHAALTASSRAKLGMLPSTAEIVFHTGQLIYSMDVAGQNITQLTGDSSRAIDHVAVSHDRRRIVASYLGGDGQMHLVVYDLEQGTAAELLPDFYLAGNGGVDWDLSGRIYFAGVDVLPFASPSTAEEFIANAVAHDVWRVRWDGTLLERLTSDPDRSEADVSVSEDGTKIAYKSTFVNPPNDFTEIRVANADGSSPVTVIASEIGSAELLYDPELSPDNSQIVFSMANVDVPPNFPEGANTAHDLYKCNLDGSGLTRLTTPGPISIIPDWRGSKILFLELDDDVVDFFGGVVINDDGTGYARINGECNIPKWIPVVADQELALQAATRAQATMQATSRVHEALSAGGA